jgi:hypothetical protein
MGISPTPGLKGALLLDRPVNRLMCRFTVDLDYEAAHERKPPRSITKEVEFGSLDVTLQNVDCRESE